VFDLKGLLKGLLHEIKDSLHLRFIMPKCVLCWKGPSPRIDS